MGNIHIDEKLINFILSRALADIQPKRIILFGSRARGTARVTSDYDLAFELREDFPYNQWAEFCVTLQEEAPTLLPMDLINLHEVNNDFKKKIVDEGIILYEDK